MREILHIYFYFIYIMSFKFIKKVLMIKSHGKNNNIISWKALLGNFMTTTKIHLNLTTVANLTRKGTTLVCSNCGFVAVGSVYIAFKIYVNFRFTFKNHDTLKVLFIDFCVLTFVCVWHVSNCYPLLWNCKNICDLNQIKFPMILRLMTNILLTSCGETSYIYKLRILLVFMTLSL